jgi:mono/diheme cytochrome c family protein
VTSPTTPTDPPRAARRPRRARRPGVAGPGAFATLATAVLLTVAGCGDGGAPDAAGELEGRAPGDPAGADGAVLYQEACASCHGDELQGTERGPSLLSEVYEPAHHPDASFRAAVRQGAPAHHWRFGDMPAIPGLDDEEVDAILAHVRARQQAEGFEPYPPG